MSLKGSISGTLLSRTALEEAEDQEKIVVGNRGEIEGLSINLEIESLLGYKKDVPSEHHGKTIRELSDACERGQEGDVLGTMAVWGGTWHLERNHLYMAKSKQSLRKARGIVGKVKSRSTWARYGLLQRTLNQDIRKAKEYSGDITFLIIPKTNVILRPGDAPAHIAFAYGCFYKLAEDEIRGISGHERIAEGAEISHGGFTLTYGKNIMRYNGKIINPHERGSVAAAFDEANIDKEIKVKKDEFFIATSGEAVRIPYEYAGYLNGHDGRHEGPEKGWVHLNAPLIKPGDDARTVVSENEPIDDMVIVRGGRMAELRLMRLARRYELRESERITRYEGQSQPLVGIGL